MNKSISHRLELNIIAIVIGALVFIGVRFWAETIFEITDSVHKVGSRESRVRRMVVSSLLISMIAVFLIILIYTYMKCNRHW